MLLTIILTLNVEHQKVSFIAALIKPFYLPLPGKNSNSCSVTHYYIAQEWGGGENYQDTWKNSDWISQYKSLNRILMLLLYTLAWKSSKFQIQARSTTSSSLSSAMQRHPLKTQTNQNDHCSELKTQLPRGNKKICKRTPNMYRTQEC